MNSNDKSDNTLHISFDVLHKLLTICLAIATAILGYWQFQLKHKLDVEKSNLNKQVERTNLVNNMLERIEGYMDRPIAKKITNDSSSQVLNNGSNANNRKRGLNETDKTRILISLLKISSEAHLEESGGLENKKQKDLVRAIPLYFALLSDNDEMLVTIGSEPEDLKLWVAFARTAADPEVKETAAIALKRIAMLSADGNVHAYIINHLLDLTVDWQVPELSTPVANALEKVLQVIDDEDLKEIPKLKEAVSQAKVKFDLLKLAPKTHLPVQIKDHKIQSISVKPKVHKTITPVFEELEAEQKETLDIKSLIAQLESDDKNIRRSARSKLGSAGNKAVPNLLEALEARRDSYRITLGVVTALLFMKQPTEIPSDQIGLITTLLGYRDGTVRKNTAKFLINYLNHLAQEGNSSSLEPLQDTITILTKNLSTQGNKNIVYNSAVVLLGIKDKVPEEMSQSLGNRLSNTIQILEQDGRNWGKTIDQINKHLE